MSQKLYKYASFEAGIKIIETGKVYADSPKNFNDPADSLLYVSDRQYENTQKLLSNYSVFLNLKDFALKTEFKGSSIILKKDIELLVKESEFDMVKCGFYRESNLINMLNNLYFSQYPEQINIVKNILSEYKERTDVSLDKIRNSIRISSFSTRWNSVLMWSHYAKSHSGICIEFERPNNEWFVDIRYSNRINEFELYKVTQEIISFNYQGLDPALTQLLKKSIKKCISVKLKDWSYEKEVRYFCLKDTDEYSKSLTNDGAHDYLGLPKISKVYAGYSIAVADYDRLKLLGEKLGFKVVKLTLDDLCGLNKKG